MRPPAPTSIEQTRLTSSVLDIRHKLINLSAMPDSFLNISKSASGELCTTFQSFGHRTCGPNCINRSCFTKRVPVHQIWARNEHPAFPNKGAKYKNTLLLFGKAVKN